MKITSRILLIFSLILLPLIATADLVLVISSKSGIKQLTEEEVINIYLGRYRRLTPDLTAIPIDLGGSSDNRVEFYRKLVDKSLAEINAYWSRLIFSGRTRPPQEAVSVEDALRLVISTPGAIAYVEREDIGEDVVIVFQWLQE